MRRTEAIAGVLIGGQSKRMGTPKALLRFRGTTFVEHLVHVARGLVDEVVLLGDAPLDIPALDGMVRLADAPDFAGPLAGLVPLLGYARDRWALLIACDMPLVDSGILGRLLNVCEPPFDAAAFHIKEGVGSFPCCSAFHPRTASQVRLELTQSASLHSLIGALRCRILEVDAAEAHRLRSFNTPEEYADLMRWERELTAARM